MDESNGEKLYKEERTLFLKIERKGIIAIGGACIVNLMDFNLPFRAGSIETNLHLQLAVPMNSLLIYNINTRLCKRLRSLFSPPRNEYFSRYM